MPPGSVDAFYFCKVQVQLQLIFSRRPEQASIPPGMDYQTTSRVRIRFFLVPAPVKGVGNYCSSTITTALTHCCPFTFPPGAFTSGVICMENEYFNGSSCAAAPPGMKSV